MSEMNALCFHNAASLLSLQFHFDFTFGEFLEAAPNIIGMC